MKKATRRKNLRKKKTRSLRGGALKHALVTGLAALSETRLVPKILPGENNRKKSIFNLVNKLQTNQSQGYKTAKYNNPTGLVTYSGEPSNRLASVYGSYLPVNHNAELLPYNSNTEWKFNSKNIGGPMANAKDINGHSVSQEEAVKRIAEWHSQVEEEQRDHAANPEDICSVQGGASSMCSGSIGIPRSLMPQIKRVNRQAFFDFLKAWTGNENLVHDEELDIESLIPTQSELMQPLIQKQINRATKNGTTPPTVIVTRDPTTGAYTLYDGHHRWAAMYQQYLASGTGGKIKTTVIDLPIMYTLELSAAFGAPHALTDV
jgi:hypothetical protein